MVMVVAALSTGCVTGDDVIIRPVDPSDVHDGTDGTFADGAYHLGAGGRGLSINVPAHPGEVLTGIEFNALIVGGDLYSYAIVLDTSLPSAWRVVAEPVYANSGHVVRMFDVEPERILIVTHEVAGVKYRGGTVSDIRLVLRYD